MNIEFNHSKWNTYNFNDIFSEYSKNNTENLEQFTVGKYGLIPKTTDRFSYDVHKHKVFEPNTLLLGIGAEEVGVSITEKGCVSPIYNTFKISNNFDSLFLKYLMPIVIEQNKYNISHTSTRRNYEIEISELKNIKISLPSLEIQKKISSLLFDIDNQISEEEKFISKLKNTKQSLLQLLFPEENTYAPKLRFKGFNEDWEQHKLSEITSLHARIGWQNLRASEYLDSGNYMLITGTDFVDGAINYSTCSYVEKERYDQDKNIQIKNGSILITKDGTLGKVAFVDNLNIPATLNAGVFNVVIRDLTKADNKYLYQYLKAPFLMDYVNKKATGGTIKHLNQNILVDFPVFMPSKEEQELMGKFFETLDTVISLHERKLEKLKQIKLALLDKLLV